MIGDNMKNKDKELEKLNNSKLKELEKVLVSIDNVENSLLNDFDYNLHNVFKEILLPVLEEVKKYPDIDKVKTRIIKVNGIEYKVPINFLKTLHNSL